VTFALLAFVIWRASALETAVGDTEPTSDLMFWFFAQIVVAVVLLLVIAWRTGEPPKWQWGFPKKKDESPE